MRTKNNLLNFADREPYEPVTELIDVPTALLEIATLNESVMAGDIEDSARIRPIIESIIKTVLDDSTSILKLKSFAESGYKIAFLSPEKLAPDNDDYN